MNVLFNLLIFSLPLGVITRITPFPNFSFYLHDAVAGAIFLLFLHKVIFEKEKISHPQVLNAFLIFIAIAFFSLILNFGSLTLSAFFVSVSYLLRFLIYGSIFFSIQFIKESSTSIAKKLMVSGAIFIVFGYIQYLLYSNLRNLYYLGWDDHLYRLFSTFLDPNFAGIFLVLILLLTVQYFFLERKTKIKIVIAMFSVLALIALYLTYSRSAFISMVLGVSILLFLNKKIKVIIPLLFGFMLLLLFFSNLKIEGLNPLRLASAEARVNSARDAIYIIKDNFIFGVGFNAYRYALLRYDLRTETGAQNSNADAGTDNSYLFILATTGIIGALAFINFGWRLFQAIKKSKKQSGFKFLVQSSLSAIFINAFFINSLFYPLILVWIFILAGTTVNKKQ